MPIRQSLLNEVDRRARTARPRSEEDPDIFIRMHFRVLLWDHFRTFFIGLMIGTCITLFLYDYEYDCQPTGGSNSEPVQTPTNKKLV